jgi:hypothetical protein
MLYLLQHRARNQCLEMWDGKKRMAPGALLCRATLFPSHSDQVTSGEALCRLGRVSDLYFHWEVCHGDSTIERRCPWYSFP